MVLVKLALLMLMFCYSQPLGFQIDDNKLKRAGLDYWPYPSCILFSPGFVFVHFKSTAK